MPVISNDLDSAVQLRFNIGTDATGKSVYKSKTLSGIKSDITNDDIMTVVEALSTLQTHTLAEIIRVKEEELLNG